VGTDPAVVAMAVLAMAVASPETKAAPNEGASVTAGG